MKHHRNFTPGLSRLLGILYRLKVIDEGIWVKAGVRP